MNILLRFILAVMLISSVTMAFAQIVVTCDMNGKCTPYEVLDTYPPIVIPQPTMGDLQ